MTYDDVEIKYTLNSTEVDVAGQTLTMSSAVTISDNGTVMAPLRFVSEALGADVTYNSESGEIVIVSAGGLDSGVNYKLCLSIPRKKKSVIQRNIGALQRQIILICPRAVTAVVTDFQ